MPKGWGRKYDYKSAPRKAMSAYSFYVQDWYRYWRRLIRTRNPHRVIREVARQWKRVDAEAKKKYNKLAEQDKIRAKAEKLKYYAMIDDGSIDPPPFRQRITKQTGYPRSTKNAYVYFSNEIRDKVRKENPQMTYVEVMREMARRWKTLNEAEKKPYRTRKETDKERYKGAKNRYRQEQKDKKKQKRFEQGRIRLNLLFNQRVPTAQAVKMDADVEGPVVPNPDAHLVVPPPPAAV